MGGKVDNTIPGPGSYEVKYIPEGPRFSIGGTKSENSNFKDRNQSPGPGQYTFNDELNIRLRGGRFSTSKRPENKPDLNPGPGQYTTDAETQHMKHEG